MPGMVVADPRLPGSPEPGLNVVLADASLSEGDLVAAGERGETPSTTPAADSCRCASTRACEKLARSCSAPRWGSVRTIRDGPKSSAAGCKGMPSSEVWGEWT